MTLNLIQKPIPYRTEAPLFIAPPLGWIMHSQEGYNSPFGWFSRLKSPKRAFSHFWISKLGVIEQYQDLRRESWAQGDGNAFYISCEFEGYVHEKLTQHQIDTAARMHILLKTVDYVVNHPGQRGVGTHSMGGQAWGHPQCPGEIRAKQRIDIVHWGARLRDGGAHPLPPPPSKPGAPWNPSNKFTVVVRPGDTGTIVRRIQAKIGGLTVDGVYGPRSMSAVQRFQSACRLTPDGIVGPLTWRKLFE